jgi:tetratricopeptide (TPR) repeat protein
VALFPRPVSLSVLASVFLEPTRAARAGALAGKTPDDLESYLGRLVALRFIRREQAGRETVYSIHPAVRDAVLASLGEDRRTVSTAAKEEMLLNLDTVSGQPGTQPTSNEALDFVEDLIEFCIQDGDFERGFELYRGRLGEYEHLSSTIGHFDRGERVSRFLGDAAERYSPPRREKLAVDHALYLLHLGRLREATLLLRKWKRVAVGRRNSALAINLAEAEWLQGEIPASIKTLNSTSFTSQSDDRCQALAFRGRAALAMGRIEEAFDHFNHSLDNQPGRPDVRIDLQGFYFEWALNLCGLHAEALAQADTSHREHQTLNWQVSAARSLVSRAEALRGLGRFAEAQDAVDAVSTWASEKNEKELLAWSRLVRSRIFLDTGKIDDGLDQASIGLQATKVNGFRLLGIDLQNEIGALKLAARDRDGAVAECMAAKEAASRPECSYARGAEDAAELIERAKEAPPQLGPNRITSRFHAQLDTVMLRKAIRLKKS